MTFNVTQDYGESAQQDKDREFLIHVAEVPPHLRGWIAFKDYIRQHINGQPGRTDADKKAACCKVKGWNNALAATKALEKEQHHGKPLIVSIFDVSGPAAQLLYQTPRQSPPASPVSPSFSSPQLPVQVSYSSIAATSAPYAAVQQYPVTSAYQYSVGYPVSGQYPLAGDYTIYESNEYGLPVNISRGTVVTERLSIHIAGLGKNASRDSLIQFLRKKNLEDFTSIEIQTDSGGKAKGSATVQFGSSDGAERAIEILHGSAFQKEVLRVKRAKESRTLEHVHRTKNCAPIVNGSTF